MTEQNKDLPPTDPRDETPNSLMDNFKGKGLLPIVVFTLVVHAVLIGGTSMGFIKDLFSSTDELSEEDRISRAVKEATPVLRDIADKYRLDTQKLSEQFAGGSSKTDEAPQNVPPEATGTPENATGPESPESTPEEGSDTTEKPKSALEKELDVKLDGPKQPTLDDEKDIF